MACTCGRPGGRRRRRARSRSRPEPPSARRPGVVDGRVADGPAGLLEVGDGVPVRGDAVRDDEARRPRPAGPASTAARTSSAASARAQPGGPLGAARRRPAGAAREVADAQRDDGRRAWSPPSRRRPPRTRPWSRRRGWPGGAGRRCGAAPTAGTARHRRAGCWPGPGAGRPRRRRPGRRRTAPTRFGPSSSSNVASGDGFPARCTTASAPANAARQASRSVTSRALDRRPMSSAAASWSVRTRSQRCRRAGDRPADAAGGPRQHHPAGHGRRRRTGMLDTVVLTGG